MMAEFTHRKTETQALMVVTKVVDTAKDLYAGSQGGILLGQSAGAAGERRQALAKGGIEPFNKGGIDDPTALGQAQQVFNQVRCALHNAALNLQMFLGALLDHLDNLDISPCDLPRMAYLPFPMGQGRTKGTLEGRDITDQAVIIRTTATPIPKGEL